MKHHLAKLFGLGAPESPKPHQGSKEIDRRLKQRYHLAAKQALRGDRCIRVAR